MGHKCSVNLLHIKIVDDICIYIHTYIHHTYSSAGRQRADAQSRDTDTRRQRADSQSWADAELCKLPVAGRERAATPGVCVFLCVCVCV